MKGLVGPDGAPVIAGNEPKVWPIGEAKIPPIPGDVQHWVDLAKQVPKVSPFDMLTWVATSAALQALEARIEELEAKLEALDRKHVDHVNHGAFPIDGVIHGSER